MPRLPVYEVVFVEGDEFYPDSWAILYSDETRDKVHKDSYGYKKHAVENARQAAKKRAIKQGMARLLVRKKDGDVSEETTYDEARM